MRIIKKLCLLCLIIALIGCTANEVENEAEIGEEIEEEKEIQGGELKFGISSQPLSLDPHVSPVAVTNGIMRNVFETLVTVDAEYNIRPMLAQSFEQSEDGKTITFHLREGVLFHNGKEMVADDVVASMNRWKEVPGTKEYFSEDASFEATDDYTVVFNLAEPSSIALPVLSNPGSRFAPIMPKEIIDNSGADGVEEYVGTGPFQFVEWKQDQYIQLTRFDDYQSRSESANGLSGERKALVDDMFFYFVTDPSTRVAGIQSGEYDIVESVPYDDYDKLEGDPNVKTLIHPGSLLSLYFNKSLGIFADLKAREAVALALNIDDILLAAYANDNFYTKNHNIMMSHQEQWSSDVGKDQYNQNDPEKALQLLDEIGYTGEEITLITSRDHDDMYSAAVVVQEQLEQIGFNVNFEVYDWPTFLDRREEKDLWDVYVMWNTPVPEPTATTFLKKEVSGWTDSPELEGLIEEYRTRPTLDQAKDLYDDLQKAFWEYLPVVRLGDSKGVLAFRDTIDNVQYQDGPILWNVLNNK